MQFEGQGGRSFDRPPREMTKVICSDCGKETEVPFKPDVGPDGKPLRPVYCRDCYRNHAPPRRDFGGGRRNNY